MKSLEIRMSAARQSRHRSCGWFKILPIFLLWSLVSVPGRAYADEFFVETGGVKTRTEAQSLLDAAAAHGLSARVVRRFRRGEGWEFVVRVDGLVDRDAAKEVAASLSRYTGTSVGIYLSAGKDVLPLDEVAVGPAAAPAPPAPTAQPAVLDNPVTVALTPAVLPAGDPVVGMELLAAVIRAHGGGASANTDLGSASSLHFRFERQVWVDEGLLRVWHDYSREGTATRLEIRILEGEGKDSTTLLRKGEGAWILVDGKLLPQEVVPIEETLESFQPDRVLDKALDLARLGSGKTAVYVGSEDEDGRTLARLLVGGSDGGAVLSLGIDQADHRVRDLTVSTSSGKIGWRYGDYHDLPGGPVVPYQIELTRDGTPKERISVLDLASPARAEAVLFSPDSLKKPQ